MKKLIQHKLRILLEGRLASHTPSNPSGRHDDKTATESDLERVMNKIVNYNNKYGDDPYFQDVTEGDGIYFVTIHTNGELTIKTPNTPHKIDDSELGIMKNSNSGNRYVLIKAYRGIPHPEFNQTTYGKVKTSSPAEDAKIKTYLVFAKEILEYIKQNMEGESSYTSDDKDFKDQTSDKNQYKYDKYEKEQQRKQNKQQISLDPEKAKELEDRQAKLQAKYAKFLRK